MLNREIESKIREHSASLEQIENINKQVDFVDEISKMANVKSMNVALGNPNTKAFNVNIKITNNKSICYEFSKNANDDYILALGGYYGDTVNTKAITEMKNTDVIPSGTDTSATPNYYCKNIGDIIQATFFGTKITYYSYTDNRGGLFEFILDEGTSGEKRINISLFSATAGYKEQVLFEGLEEKSHTIKGVFKGQDTSNPVTSPRGWIYYGGTRTQDTFRTFNVYGDAFTTTKGVQALYSYSNKDFAINVKQVGSSLEHSWIPEHNAQGSAFKIDEPQLIVDGNVVKAWKDGSFLTNVNTIQLVQRVRGYNVGDLNNPLVEITTYHTIKNGVMTVNGRIKALKNIEIKDGYALMLPYWANWVSKIKTSTKNLYTPDVSGTYRIEYWGEKDKVKSIVLLNNSYDDEKSDVVCAMSIDNIGVTNRYGENGVANPFSWIEHRSSTMGKIYFCQFSNATLPLGYEYNFLGRYIVNAIKSYSKYNL